MQDTPLLRRAAFKRNLIDMMFFGSNLDPVNVLTLTQVYDLRMKRMIFETLVGILDDVVSDSSESVVNSMGIGSGVIEAFEMESGMGEGRSS